MDRILMESSEWNALLISGVTRSVYSSCLSCCAAALDVWRHPVKVNAAAMHAMAMMICFFKICDGCGVLLEFSCSMDDRRLRQIPFEPHLTRLFDSPQTYRNGYQNYLHREKRDASCQ
jgi:hypothetical protein